MGSSELLPTLKDLYLPAVIAALYWVFKRTASPLVARSILFFKLLRYRELKLVKKIRADKLKIARELHKESALYVSFLLSAVVSIGLIILPIQIGPRSIYDKIIIFLYIWHRYLY